MAKTKIVKVEEEKEGVVKQEDFNKFKETVEATQNRILDLLEQQAKLRDAVPETPAQIVEKDPSNNDFLPNHYQKIIDKHFDPTDGFEGRITFPEMNPEGGEMGGITFTLVVPPKFSNMTDAHKKFYKVDLRTVALRPENIIRGIDQWCAKVSQNLRYNKLMKTK